MKRYLKAEEMTTLLSGCFFSLLLINGDSYKLAAIPLALFALFALPKTRKSICAAPIKLAQLALFSYFAVTAISLVINGGELSQLDMPSRVILASFIMALIYCYPPSLQTTLYSICLGASIAGIIAIHQFISTGGRALSESEGYMVIQAGGIASGLSMLAIVVYLFSLQVKNKLLQVSSILATMLGLCATLLSGARGAWLLIPFIVLGLFIFHRHMFSQKAKWGSLIALVVVVIFSYPNIAPRVNLVINDLKQYQNDDATTSSGVRLEMWKSALYSGFDKPVFGQGFDGVQAAKEKQVSEGLVDKAVLGYSRAHNQLFEELQTKGLIGVTTLLFFFGAPFVVLVRKLRSLPQDDPRYYLSLMGIVHITSVIGSSITQHYLSHNSGIIFYSVGVAIFVGMVFSPTLNYKGIRQ
ncbi:O-antigen ligase family protein [Vibrio sp. D404a]|uniref:O-antigen ligase family protein n=1 Tax=unclassified Vibrio TaxID=2614977 RepID=UPI002555A0ED|nr:MULTISPECIES: O-antigen ligase family protein [unclassified Vibrio]MDK9737755.1 O-antigen ligase family protein [Vibrio sp. D404a]MDK9795357.1 O-antigen ligase family protein [Vibrio sp. D449a]